MIKIIFKAVGQGDSIILEWEVDGNKSVGIIDCNIVDGRNPTLDYLQANSINQIKFIVLSHFHIDHFSGMGEIFDYCITKKIKVGCFYHSLDPLIGNIYDRIFTSQTIGKAIEIFFAKYDLFDKYAADQVQINSHLAEIALNSRIKLKFLAPEGRIYPLMTRQLSRKRNIMPTSSADINKLSSLILIASEDQGVLLTADTTRKVFRSLKKLTLPKMLLIQVPHHGSWLSIYNEFWKNLKKEDKCPAVFSVGDEPKDKLPNLDTVKFFDSLGYEIFSTENVYGISQFTGIPVVSVLGKKKQNALNQFSKKTKQSGLATISSNFSGDQFFSIAL